MDRAAIVLEAKAALRREAERRGLPPEIVYQIVDLIIEKVPKEKWSIITMWDVLDLAEITWGAIGEPTSQTRH